MSTPNGKAKPEHCDALKELGAQILVDEPLRKDAPTLHDLLCQKWKEGVCTRQAGSIAVRPEGTCYRVTLQCPTEGVQTSVYMEKLEDLIAILDEHVRSNRCVWTMTYAKTKKVLSKLES